MPSLKAPRGMANFETGFRTTSSEIETEEYAELLRPTEASEEKFEQKVAKETKGNLLLRSPRVMANFETLPRVSELSSVKIRSQPFVTFATFCSNSLRTFCE
jgi:hypothetical protein